MVNAQHQPPRDTGKQWPCWLRIAGLQLGDVSQQFLFVGQAAEVEAEHLKGPLGRLVAGPQTDEQAGDDCQVDLNRNSILAMRDQMPVVKDTFQPVKEKF